MTMEVRSAEHRRPFSFAFVRTHGRPLIFVAWVLAILVGCNWLYRYAATAGEVGATPDQWPDHCSLVHDDQATTAIMFAHPLCPCTSASLSELESIVRATGTMATVVFWQPTIGDDAKAKPVDWTSSDLIQRARDNERLNVVMDTDGLEAARFGAKTSGFCVVYDNDGTLRYHGGITQGRGHLGVCDGNVAVGQLLSDQSIASEPGNHFPVFGCPL